MTNAGANGPVCRAASEAWTRAKWISGIKWVISYPSREETNKQNTNGPKPNHLIPLIHFRQRVSFAAGKTAQPCWPGLLDRLIVSTGKANVAVEIDQRILARRPNAGVQPRRRPSAGEKQMIANDNLPTLANRAYREVQAQLRLRGEASACAIFAATRATLDLPEEECGLEIFGAMSLAVRQGLVDCSTFDPLENSIVYGADTVLTPTFPVLQ